MPKQKRINARQRKLVNLVVANAKKGKDALPEYKLAEQAGYKHPKKTAYQVLRRPEIQSILAAEMERQGLTEKYLVEKLKEGTEATETKLASFEGTFTDQKVVPDFQARHNFVRLCCLLRGDFEEKPQNNSPTLNLQIIQNFLGMREVK